VVQIGRRGENEPIKNYSSRNIILRQIEKKKLSWVLCLFGNLIFLADKMEVIYSNAGFYLMRVSFCIVRYHIRKRKTSSSFFYLI
jgi:hypothetical protein